MRNCRNHGSLFFLSDGEFLKEEGESIFTKLCIKMSVSLTNGPKICKSDEKYKATFPVIYFKTRYFKISKIDHWSRK